MVKKQGYKNSSWSGSCGRGEGGEHNLKSWGVGYVGGLHEIEGEETCASYDIKRSFEVMHI